MILLSTEQHQHVLRNLHDLGRDRVGASPLHSAGAEYTSLMTWLLLQNLQSAGALLRLAESFTNGSFPVAAGYALAGALLETDVTAHYICLKPTEYAHDFVSFGAVLMKRQMDACTQQRTDKSPEGGWQHYWAKHRRDVDRKYQAVADKFSCTDKEGNKLAFDTWSGKTLRQMATVVEHVEAYDIFHSELAAVTHADLGLAERFLQPRPAGQVWLHKADDLDVCHVFRHSATFFTCFLKLFGRQFGTWSTDDVQHCWEV